MAQTNSNASNVQTNTATVLPGFGGITPAGVITATTTISTILNDVNSGNVDVTNVGSTTYNDDYSTVLNYTDAVAAAGRTNTATLLTNHALFGQGGEFLPTEGTLSAGVTGEFNPSVAARTATTAGNYFNPLSWTAVPKASELTGNASAFTFNHTDGGKTVTLTETINGSPFATGNGAVSEALTFRGTANDTLVAKHNVTVANVPAATNTNTTNTALDVRNENYAETYAKQGVTSNYAWNSAHKYAEVNGNQSLNDAFAQSYSYKDADLTINSTVKTNLADSANINGSERIVENKAANYSYAHAKTGSVNYVVTDTRNLAQVDQRTWTNTTVTNVAKFEVKDLANATTITAKGLVTGTTTNLSTAANAALPNTFKSTGAEFKVDSAHYALAVDTKEFDLDHGNVQDSGSNALLALVDTTSSTGDVFNSALGNGKVPVAFNKYVSVATDTLTGTQFNDVITVKDVAGAVAGTFVGGNVNAGIGNDTITGSKGADTITVGTGTKEADVIIGFETQDKLVDAGKAFQAKTVTQLADGNIEVVAANGYKVVLQKPSATLGDVQKYANPFDFSSATTAQTIGGGVEDVKNNADVMIGGLGNDTITGGKGADKLTGGAGADTFKYTDVRESNGSNVDTITDFKTAVDKIDLSAIDANGAIAGDTAFVFVNTPFTAAGQLRFDAATNTLQGNTDANVATVELSILLTGVTAVTATDFVL